MIRLFLEAILRPRPSKRALLSSHVHRIGFGLPVRAAAIPRTSLAQLTRHRYALPGMIDIRKNASIQDG